MLEALIKELKLEEGAAAKLIAAVEEGTAGLVNKNKELLGEVKALKTGLKKFEGIDPDAVKELLEKTAANEEELAKKRGEFDKLLETERKKAKAEIDAREDKIKGMSKSVERHLIEAAVSRAIADAKGNSRLLYPHVRERVQVQENNGEYSVVVIDDKGNPRDGITVSKLIDEYRQDKDFSGAFPQNAGGGANGGKGGALNQDLSKLPPEERLKMARRKAA